MKYTKPREFKYNIISIGAGAAGLVTSYIGAATKAKVALIERHKMGGDCLNTGCVPSKALIRSAKFMHEIKKCESLGFKKATVEYEFSDIMERIQRVIKKIEPHDSVERYSKLGVDCIQGEAKILSPYEVEVNNKVLTTRNIVVATGARPFVPPIPGIEDVDALTSDTVWDIREKPERLIVLGGGPIGAELAQSFQRLGSKVTQIEMNARLLPREDPEVSKIIHEQFKKDGVDVLLSHKATRFYKENGNKYLECEFDGKKKTIEFDQVLVAIGRRANTSGFGLEDLGIELNKNGTIKVDDYQRTTRYSNIYACGDVSGPFQFTHTAAHQAWFCAVNALIKPFWGFKTNYDVIPWCTYTDPEVARVGFSEMDAKRFNIPYQVTTYGIDDLDRAICDESDYGFVKVLTSPKSDKILGATIVGVHAGDIIAEYVAAMKHGFGMNKILGTIHIYPTLAEANKYAAGEWKRANVKPGALVWAEKFNKWRR